MTTIGIPPGANIGGRDTYRHGDLSRALVEAGVELARAGGPAAVALRAATRRAGVSPNAAYRHFADRRALGSFALVHSQTALAAPPTIDISTRETPELVSQIVGLSCCS